MSGHQWIIGVRGAVPNDDVPYGIDPGLILKLMDGQWIAVNDEHPVALKVSDNWTDDFDGRTDKDYPVEIQIYRPGREPFEMVWKTIMLRSHLQIKPELVYLDSAHTSGADK